MDAEEVILRMLHGLIADPAGVVSAVMEDFNEEARNDGLALAGIDLTRKPNNLLVFRSFTPPVPVLFRNICCFLLSLSSAWRA